MRSVLGTSTIQPRSTRPGDRLSLIVLRGGRCPIGIDVASGALVLASEPVHPGADGRRRHPTVGAFDVVAGRLASDEELELWSERARPARARRADGAIVLDGTELDDERHELAVLAGPLRQIGRVSQRRAQRYLKALHHPRTGPILGFHGTAAPFWSVDPMRPSISVVMPESAIGIRVTEHSISTLFRWRGILHALPTEAPEVLSRLDWLPTGVTTGPPLADALGFEPRELVVRLSGPIDGVCHKLVAGVVPRR
jgi:hypothetical protein